MQQLKRIECVKDTPASFHVKQGISQAAQVFDASEEGLEQGLKHLAQVAVIRETARVMKQQLKCPKFVTCMED